MGNQHNVPETTTKVITVDNFYSMSLNNNDNIYESRLSNSNVNKQLIHKTISFT